MGIVFERTCFCPVQDFRCFSKGVVVLQAVAWPVLGSPPHSVDYSLVSVVSGPAVD